MSADGKTITVKWDSMPAFTQDGVIHGSAFAFGIGTVPDGSGKAYVVNGSMVGETDNCSALKGNVFWDRNEDGTNNNADQNLEGIKVVATSGDQTFETTTDKDGNYSFTNLPAGTWTVKITAPDNYGGTREKQVTVPKGEEGVANFPLTTIQEIRMDKLGEDGKLLKGATFTGKWCTAVDDEPEYTCMSMDSWDEIIGALSNAGSTGRGWNTVDRDNGWQNTHQCIYLKETAAPAKHVLRDAPLAVCDGPDGWSAENAKAETRMEKEWPADANGGQMGDWWMDKNQDTRSTVFTLQNMRNPAKLRFDKVDAGASSCPAPSSPPSAAPAGRTTSCSSARTSPTTRRS